jgi:nucleoside 2-deoxyribosyltransferase
MRAAGHSVFVPHEQHYNTIDNASDADIYHFDMNAMLEAEVCVVVSRVGVDCAFEIGWFEGQDVPVLYYLPTSIELDRHPMLYRALTFGRVYDTETLLNRLQGLVLLSPADEDLDEEWECKYGDVQ